MADDVYDGDPNVGRLEREMAKRLGKEASIFVASGTMSNLLAMMVHAHGKMGVAAFVGNKSHVYEYEQGGMAKVAGIMPVVLQNSQNGTFDLDELEKTFSNAKGKSV